MAGWADALTKEHRDQVNAQGQSLADTYGVPISSTSQDDLNSTAEGLGLSRALYGETMGAVGNDAADYTNQVKGRLGKDYAGADLLRQQSSSQVAKATGNAGLGGVNNLAMQNQLYNKGALEARTANQDYQDKSLAAYGRNISARQSGQSGILMGYKGLGNAKTPGSYTDYGGTIICTELYKQGKLTKNEYARTTIFGLTISEETHSGYLFLATPIVSLMKKSDKFSNLFIGWAKSIASHKPNLLTRILMPLCWSIGYVRKTTQKKATRIA